MGPLEGTPYRQLEPVPVFFEAYRSHHRGVAEGSGKGGLQGLVAGWGVGLRALGITEVYGFSKAPDSCFEIQAVVFQS